MVETVVVEKEGRMQRQCRWRLRLASTLALSKMLLMVMLIMIIVIIIMMAMTLMNSDQSDDEKQCILTPKSSIPLNLKSNFPILFPQTNRNHLL